MALTEPNVDDLAEESGIDYDIFKELYYNQPCKTEPQDVAQANISSGKQEPEKELENTVEVIAFVKEEAPEKVEINKPEKPKDEKDEDMVWEEEEEEEEEVRVEVSQGACDEVLHKTEGEMFDWGTGEPLENVNHEVLDKLIVEVSREAKEEVIEDAKKQVIINKEQLEEVPERPRRQLRPTARATNYNLRGRSTKATRLKRPTIWINKRLESNCFWDRALTKIINLDDYLRGFGLMDADTELLLELSKKTKRSQLDSFTFNQRKYIVTTWLSVVRIFEYNPNKSHYFEVKRLPQRYIDMHKNLVTSVRYDNERVYIAYLADQYQGGYIEIRDLRNRLLTPAFQYDGAIDSIQSDEDFIYVKTVDNAIHIHKKNHFVLTHKCIDLIGITNNYVSSVKARNVKSNPITKFDLLISTSKQFLVLNYTPFKISIKQNYNLDPDYTTVSTHYQGDLIVMHRNLTEPDGNNKCKSKLVVGALAKGFFIHERTINYEYHIMQVELGAQDTIFLLGRSASDRYETCRLKASDFSTPLWSWRIGDIYDNTTVMTCSEDLKMIVHEDHLVILSQNQRMHCLRFEGNRFNDCQMLQSAETLINVNVN